MPFSVSTPPVRIIPTTGFPAGKQRDPKSDKNEIVPKNTGIPMKIITFTESKTCKAWIPF